MARTSITVAPETAMDFRAVRVEMSSAEGGGKMLSVDEVLANLITCWRERGWLGHGDEAKDSREEAPHD